MDNSKILLEIAIKSLKEANIKDELWAVGGGTVLSSIYNHRLSKDIDIFVYEPQLLSSISPRFNSITENALDYAETNSFISLTFPKGKIDFINASQISKFMPVKKEFLGQNIFVEDEVEIVSKKMFFRGKYALPRDLFDLAVVYNSNRKNDLIETLNSIPDKIAIFKKAFLTEISNEKFKPYTIFFNEMLLESNIIKNGNEIQYCQLLLKDLEKQKLVNLSPEFKLKKNKRTRYD